MPRLSWLAYAGNPCTAQLEQEAHGQSAGESISWSDLSVGPLLGQGASGLIHQAVWRQADGRIQDVAVKIFKSEVTSDGLPLSEMGAALSVGTHAGLISVIGHVTDHPQGTPVLVLQLLSEGVASLAGPPSFETCTRDVYARDASFHLSEVVAILYGLADVMSHIHGKGITHGDLYAHNILLRGRSAPVLSDFGAATMHALEGGAEALGHQALEMRAFACLMEELLSRCVDGASKPEVFQQLWHWEQQACSTDVKSRPSFVAMRDALERARHLCCN